MAVLDLKDAYYSVPIATEDRQYLRFAVWGQLYEFVCLPNGLSSAPKISTKLLKLPLAVLLTLKEKQFCGVKKEK